MTERLGFISKFHTKRMPAVGIPTEMPPKRVWQQVFDTPSNCKNQQKNLFRPKQELKDMFSGDR
jgi:hypothetical protein